MSEFFAGLKSYGRAWRLIRNGRMWPLLIIPGMIGLLYFPLFGLLTVWHGGKVTRYLQENWLPDFLKQQVVAVLITVIVWVLALYLGYIFFRNLVMVLYAPVLSYLSQRTEEQALGRVRAAENPASMVRGALRAIGMSLTSLVLSLGCFVLLLFLLLIPIVGQIAMAVLLPLSQMFFAGHGFVDPTIERRNMSVGQSFKFAWQNRGRIIGCGAGFVLLTMIPVLGWFLGPTLAVVAGTIVTLDKLEASDKQ
jgi:CysZ protein